MKTILFWILGCILWSLNMTATSSDYAYLKIKLSEGNEINYPPGTGFVAEDASGNTILNPEMLQEIGTYEVLSPITLWVFTFWSDEPDVFELTSGKLLMGKTDRTYHVANAGRSKQQAEDHYTRPMEGEDVKQEDTKRSNPKYGGWKGSSNGVSIIRERYYGFDEETGYDSSLEFSNGVIFYFRDGEASAYQQGDKLTITGKYLIETKSGIIKLSYNSKTKKVWWVFEKSE